MTSTMRVLTGAAGLLALAMIAAPTTASADNPNPCLQRHSPAGAVYWNPKCRVFNTYHAPQHDPYAGQIQAPSSLQMKQKHRRLQQIVVPRR